MDSDERFFLEIRETLDFCMFEAQAASIVSKSEIRKNRGFLNRGPIDLSPTLISSGSLTIARYIPDIFKFIDGLIRFSASQDQSVSGKFFMLSGVNLRTP